MKNSRETMYFTNMIQIVLTNIYRIFYPNKQEYTFSAPHGSFSKIDDILSHKAREILPCILSEHRGLKLDFKNNTGNTGKPTHSWKLNNYLQQWPLGQLRNKEKN